MSDSAENRLPRTVLPSHYDTCIKTDLEALTFSGTSEILVQVSEPVEFITIHAASPLKVEGAVLASTSLKTESVRPATKIQVDEKKERLVVHFAGGEIPKGEHKIGFRFKGTLDTSMLGYYRSSFSPKGGKEGEKAYYALTQFEPCQARRAFPCFDEPDMKATHSISLISRVGTTSLSNSEVISTKHLGKGGDFERTELLTDSFFSDSQASIETIGKTEGKTEGTTEAKIESAGEFKDDWELIKFGEVPKVSSYLVAWANGNFESIEGSYKSPLTGDVIPLKVYATYDHIEQAQLALRTKERCLPIYEKIFDIPYPLPKLDTLIAADFDAGAMENWGLITGRTSVYAYDEKKSGIAAKKRVIGVQSHEVAHQWFGNICTMRWWDNLWLNESFATLMGEVIIIDELEPSWKIHSSFISEHLSQALNLDALRSSHPIEVPCPDEATISMIFDSISYSKGGSVLKMLSNFVGQDTFLKGVSTYLKRHLYGNARTADLFKGISDVYGKDVSKMMENWTIKIGFPLITVEETEKGIKIRQNRFLSTADATPEEDQTIWQVPLEPLVVEGGKKSIKHGVLLTDREDTLEIQDVKNATYKLNAETCGVYRVLYPAERLVKIGEEAGKENSVFSLNDRMGLVQDATVLASSGYAKTSTALSLLSKLGNEKENLVWQEIAGGLGSVSATWWEQPQEVRDAIAKFRRSLFKPVVDRLGFEYSESDDVDTIELRSLAIATAAVTGDEAVLAEYKRRFEPLLEKDDDSLIPSDLRTSIFSQSVRHGGEKEYKKVLEVYRKPATPAHKLSAIAALCATEDSQLLKKTFDMILSDEVKTQDIAYFFSGLRGNRHSKRDLWSWFKTNYDEIAVRFKGNFSIGRLVAASFSGFSTEEDVKAAEAFFADKDRSAYQQPLDQAVDSVRAKAKWLERDVKDVESWLKENQYL